MPRFRRITAFLNIEPGEERLIGLLILLYFLLALGFVFVQSIAFGVFLAEYGPPGLPYSYIANAIFASLAAVLYIKLGERVSFSTLLKLNLTFLATCCFLAWLGLKSTFAHEVSFLLPLLFQIVANFGSLAVWTLAGRIFNVQQAKRLFPLLGVGLWLGNILGGLLVSPLVRWMGAINILLSAAVSFGLGLLVLRLITNTYLRETVSTSRAPRLVSTAKRSNGLLRNRYILLIFSYVTLWWMAFFVLDNIFSERAAARFPDVNQLTAFMGQLLSVTGMVALIFSTFLASRIIRRFGLRAGLISEVLIVTFMLALLVISGNLRGALTVVFILASLAKLITVALGFSLSAAAYGLLFQPLPDTQRGRAQAVADGIFQPIASGLAGISLLALTRGLNFNYLGLSYAYLVLGTGLMIVILLLSRRYVHALTQAITKRRLGESPSILADPASIALLRSRLYDPHPGVALYALNKLEGLDGQTIISELPNLIRHPAPEVRREAFLRVEKLKLRNALNEVQIQLSTETVPSVKESALRAIGAIADEYSQLITALSETDVHGLRGALIGLLKYRNDSTAQQKLNGLLASASSDDRNLAIEVLGEVNRREGYPHLIRACDSSDTSRAASLALASIGAQALPEIEAAFCDTQAPRQRLFTLAKVLGRIGGTQAQALLASRIPTPDHELRSQILNAMSQSDYRTKDIILIQQAIQAEAEQTTWASAAQVDLGEMKETALLMEALKHFHAQIRSRVLSLLSFVFDSDPIRRVREAFSVGSPAQISYALEIMDAQLPSDWKGWVMPLLEDLSPQARSQRFAAFSPQEKQKTEERLGAIIENEHFPFWVRACAAYTSTRLGLATRKGDIAMLSTVEKVLILKTVSMFNQTPDNVLAEVADLLEEVDVIENETIFKQGDPGDSLYVILDGKVRVHDGERLLNYLGERDVFGEMALLDPEPRLASVTAVEATRLFRLDQAPFYQLIGERPEVATGIIRVLTGHLRNRVRDIAQLNARIEELENGKST